MRRHLLGHDDYDIFLGEGEDPTSWSRLDGQDRAPVSSTDTGQVAGGTPRAPEGPVRNLQDRDTEAGPQADRAEREALRAAGLPPWTT